MDTRPIGIFDSGLGGMTAARVLEEILSGENLVYFGDNRNVPYGTRTKENITELATAGVDFLCGFDCKALIVACGTVCANAMDALKARFPLPIFGVIEAPCRQAAAQTKTKRIAVIATEASVRSGVFEQTLKELDPSVEVFCKPCQSFVTMVESGHYAPDDPVVQKAVAEELAPVKAWHPDQMLLACTHFPLLTEAIGNEMGPDTALISVSAAAAEDMKRSLARDGLLGEAGQGSRQWYTSGNLEDFAKYGAAFLGHSVAPQQHICEKGEDA